MRTIGFRSNVLFAIAAAFGIIAALDRPWYGPAPESGPYEMENLFSALGRSFAEDAGTTGWVALQTADRLLTGLAIGTVVLLVLALAPALQRHVQPLARWTGLATLGVVVVCLLDGPDAAAMTEPRHGLFIALGSAGVLVASAMTVAAAPVRRREAPKVYTPPPAPVYDPDAQYGPPQF